MKLFLNSFWYLLYYFDVIHGLSVTIPASLECKKDPIVGVICNLRSSVTLKSKQIKITEISPKDCEKNIFVEIALKNHSEHLPLNIGEHFKNIENLLIQSSSLKYLKREDFESMKKIEVLSLIYNQIESLPHDVLHDLINLRHFDVANNQITSLPAELFKNAPNLMVFYAPHNRISEIPPELFENTKTIWKIDLKHNQIEQFYVNEKVKFKNILTLSYFSLEKNKNDCDLIFDRAMKEKMNTTVIKDLSVYNRLEMFEDDICHKCSLYECVLDSIPNYDG